MSNLTAMDALTDAKRVEDAYREQAAKAVARYNAAAGHDPHSTEAEQAWPLRKEALGQWKKARADLEEARARHRRALMMRNAWGGL